MLTHQDRELVKDVQISDGIRFGGPQGFVRTRVIRFYVGTQGPFTATVDLADYNAQRIEDIFANEIATLRAAKVI